MPFNPQPIVDTVLAQLNNQNLKPEEIETYLKEAFQEVHVEADHTALYRALSLKLHPDKVTGTCPSLDSTLRGWPQVVLNKYKTKSAYTRATSTICSTDTTTEPSFSPFTEFSTRFSKYISKRLMFSIIDGYTRFYFEDERYKAPFRLMFWILSSIINIALFIGALALVISSIVCSLIVFPLVYFENKLLDFITQHGFDETCYAYQEKIFLQRQTRHFKEHIGFFSDPSSVPSKEDIFASFGPEWNTSPSETIKDTVFIGGATKIMLMAQTLLNLINQPMPSGFYNQTLEVLKRMAQCVALLCLFPLSLCIEILKYTRAGLIWSTIGFPILIKTLSVFIFNIGCYALDFARYIAAQYSTLFAEKTAKTDDQNTNDTFVFTHLTKNNRPMTFTNKDHMTNLEIIGMIHRKGVYDFFFKVIDIMKNKPEECSDSNTPTQNSI